MNRELKELYSVDMGGGKSMCMVLQEISPTLTTTHYGEPVVAYDESITSKEVRNVCSYVDVVGALAYDDYKGPNNQYVNQGKLIVEEINSTE